MKQTKPTRRGLMLVVSAPSGSGKTTLCDRLRDEFSRLSYSVSVTTRAPRGEEQDGVHYHFVSDEVFSSRLARGEFAEWAQVHGNRYGTTIAAVDQALEADQDLLMDVDVQGAAQLRRHYPEDMVSVFILPPSMQELARRLSDRGTDAEAVIQRRLSVAREEVRSSDPFDFMVVNDDLDRAYDDLRAVYRAAHQTRARQAHVVARLLAGA